ncbi:MAG: DUF177 domain-containing protein [Oscillospiraceae bacterium]|nr:DUF177 domain-containing protein [Oscillospiraceae bacterium]MCL1952948.1 DUF177 domain-containing protein [Oscillospiraceae bacterium]
MYLELEPVFNTPGLSVPFDFALEGFEGMLSFAAPPHVVGWVKNRTGVVTLEGKAEIVLDAVCDRCAAPFEYRAEVPLEHTLVLSLNREDSDGLILLEGPRFSPDSLVWEDIVFSMPPKLLCKPGCAGLCQRCGRNLNEGPCQCKPEGDPRWAALQDLL